MNENINPRFARSPYRRRKRPAQGLVDQSAEACLFSPSPSPSQSDSVRAAKRQKKCSRTHQHELASSSASGTEADDEGYLVFKNLPRSTLKSKRKLRQHSTSYRCEPLLPTPSSIDGEERRGLPGYFRPLRRVAQPVETGRESHAGGETLERRRRAELLRRTSEVLLLGYVGCIVLNGFSILNEAWLWHKELALHLTIVSMLLVLYFLQLLFLPQWSDLTLRWGRIRLPSSYDPATLLYPVFLPILVGLSLQASQPGIVLLNIILALAALPARLVPQIGSGYSYNSLHWMLTMMPLVMYNSNKRPPVFANECKLPSVTRPQSLDVEALTLIYPLHRALLQPLHYLSATSLFASELQLLSIALINLLFFSSSPQMIILEIILWIGGVGMFVLCAPVLRSNVVLERMASWRLRKTPPVINAAASFFSELSDSLKLNSDESYLQDSEKEIQELKFEPLYRKASTPASKAKSQTVTASSMRKLSSSQVSSVDRESEAISRPSATPQQRLERFEVSQKCSKGFPTTSDMYSDKSSPKRHAGNRSTRSDIDCCLSLTSSQAETRKWLYASYTYLVTIVLILFTVRPLVASWALHNYEPIGWAIGYLFSDFLTLRSFVLDRSMESWIVYPKARQKPACLQPHTSGCIERLRQNAVGQANTRLIMFLYWLGILILGISTVVRLSSTVAVDTRRKIFHGMMVAILLPTTFIDPAFLSLGLILVLAVFLLLEVFRAAQLKLLSKPLTAFLAPYIDGRDLCGPVVVSHIFLLIGCAIPLWLSLAGVPRIGSSPWNGWEVPTRDVSMVSGVICVGLGDAAASLIGRRYGRHKWPWAGGKSLEGSAAFTAAVSVGLMCAKVWLKLGGWMSTTDDNDLWITIIAKSVMASVGASLTEAVLTGCNDNVVVPIILWLLVRGLRL